MPKAVGPRLTRLLPALAVLSLGVTACEKIQPPASLTAGLPPKPIAARDSIPLEYGDLVGVAPGAATGSSILFFQRADKSIVALALNAQQGVLGDSVVEIPRR